MAYSNIIKGLNIPIGMDADGFFASLKELDKGFKAIKDEFYDLRKNLKLEWDSEKFIQAQELAAKSVEKAKERIDLFNKALKQMETDGIAKTSADYREVEKELSKANTALQKMIKETQQLGTLKLDNLKTQVDEVEKKLGATEKQVSSLKESLKIEWNADKFMQAQELAKQAVSETQEKAQALQNVIAEMERLGVDKTSGEYRKFQAELTATETAALKTKQQLIEINKLQLNEISEDIDKISEDIELATGKATLLRERLETKFTHNALKDYLDASQDVADKTNAKIERLKTLMSDMERNGFGNTTKEFKEAANEVTALENELKKIEKQKFDAIKSGAKEFGEQLDVAKGKTDLLREKLETKFTHNALKEFAEASNSALNKTAEKISALEKVMLEMEKADPAVKQTAEFKELENQVIGLNTEIIKFKKELKDVGNVNLTWLSEKFKEIGTQVESVGKSLLPLSAGATAALTVATKAAIDQESAFAGVKKTVEATEAEYAALKQQLIDLSEVIPLSAKELMGIAESAGQLGIEKENIIAFTQVMADLGVSTNLTGEEAASTFAKFANITQMPQENFSRLGSSVVALGKCYCPVIKKFIA